MAIISHDGGSSPQNNLTSPVGPQAVWRSGWKFTAYAPSAGGINAQGDPTVGSTGTKVASRRTIAVDPKAIPYGSIVAIKFDDFNAQKWNGIYLAEDTGGAMRQANSRGEGLIDVLLEPLSEALNFGRRTGSIAILQVGKGPADAREKSRRWDEILPLYLPVLQGGNIPFSSGVTGDGPLSTDFRITGDGFVTKTVGITTTQQQQSEVEIPPIDNIAGQVAKPTEVPPSYYDDDFGELPHRAMNMYMHFCRIGDTYLAVPPTQIKVSESNGINTYKTVRQKQSMKVHSGAKTKIIEMSLMFPSYKHINGWQVKGPDGAVYYMDGLNSLLAQMKTMPFLPIENDYLNEIHQIHAVAVLNVSVETVEGFPNCLRANLTLLEFDSTPYIYAPSELYGHHFNWPLFRWHYQKQLAYTSAEITTHADYSGQDFFTIWHIDEEAMGAELDNIYEKNKKAAMDAAEKSDDYTQIPDREITMFDMNMKDDKYLYKEVNFPNSLIMVSANASTGNTFTPLNIEETGRPAYQYFGSHDTRFHFIFETMDPLAVAQVRHIKDEIDRMSRTYRDRFVGGMVLVENPFMNFHGVNACLIESLSVTTVPNFPGRYMVSLSILSMDKTQYQDEKLNFVSGGWKKDANGVWTKEEVAKLVGGTSIKFFDNNIIQEVAAEEALDKLELYPDLNLPTYKQVNQIIPKINKWRKDKGLATTEFTELEAPIRGRYVDPDFYFCYPPLEKVVKSIGKMMDPNIGIENFNWTNFYGPSMSEEIRKNNSDELLNRKYNELMHLGKDGDGNFKDGHEMVMQQVLKDKTFVLNSANYQKKFWTKAWTSKDGGEWVSTEEDEAFKDKDYQVIYFKGQRPNEKEIKNFDNEEIYQRMMHDMIRYDKRGTMMRAFPTYVFVIVEEGQIVNAVRMWNNYYTYHSIVDISVAMDKKNPIHTATLTLSNIYGSLNHTNTFQSAMPDLGDPGLGTVMQQIKDIFFHEIKERAIQERFKIYDSAQLFAGARVHIRLGYGSTASLLPPVFNGTIAEIQAGDVVQIVAQSDGHELTKMIAAKPEERNSMFFQGIEPQDIFRHYMVERNDNWFFAYRDTADARSYESAYGIEHFGYIRVLEDRKNSNFFSPINGALGPHLGNKKKAMNAEDYDIMKNIYMTSYLNDTITKAMLTYSDKQLFDMQYEKMRDQLRTLSQYNDASLDHYIGGLGISSMQFGEAGNYNPGISTTKAIGRIKTNTDLKAALKALDKKGVTKRVAVTTDDEHSIGSGGLLGSGGRTTYENKFHPFTMAELRQLKSSCIYYFAHDTGKNSSADIEKTKKAIDAMVHGVPKSADILEIISLAKSFASDQAKVWVEVEKIKAEIKKRKAKTGGEGEFSNDEANVVMRLDNKSPFDVFRTIQRVTPEFIVYPHIHNFHYTLFFGKPWWDVQCQYILPPIKNAPDKYGEKISDYVELTKPFQQSTMYISGTDIVGNTIKAVGTNLITAAMPVYYMDKEEKEFDEIIWADYSIRSSFQSTQVINTDLVQNIDGLPSFIDSLVQTAWTGVANLLGKTTKYQKYSVMFVQAAIAESFEDMYQGELIVMGDPAAKPFNIFYMQDSIQQMNGIAQMGRVVHHFGLDTGFITAIKPDLCVAKNPDPLSVSGGWGKEDEDGENTEVGGQLMVYTQTASKFTFAAIFGASVLYTANRMRLLYHTGNMLSALKQHKFNYLYYGAKVYNKVGDLGKGIANVYRAFRSVQGVWSRFMAAGATAGSMVPVGNIAAIVVTGAVWVIGNEILKYTERMFTQRFKNTIKIMPLFYKKSPYVAGINGHKNLIPGWQDNGSGRAYLVEDWEKAYQPPDESFKTWKEYAEHAERVEQTMGDLNVAGVVGNWESVNWFIKNLDLAKMQTGNKAFYCPVSVADKGKQHLGILKKGGGGRITSSQGPRNGKIHYGVDISRGNGLTDQDIIAMYGGTVVYSGKGTGYGGVVVIQHVFDLTTGAKGPAGMDNQDFLDAMIGAMGGSPAVVESQSSPKQVVAYTLYAHLKRRDVQTGDPVIGGQIIGKMGGDPGDPDRGTSTGKHLHFEFLFVKSGVTPPKKANKDHYSWVVSKRANTEVVDGAEALIAIGQRHPGLVKFKPENTSGPQVR